MSHFEVQVSVDGVAATSIARGLPLGSAGSATFEAPLRFRPGTNETHTLRVNLYDTCSGGDHYTVSDLRLDVVGLA